MTPEEEQRVRRALADAAHPDGSRTPMPPEVADRLDDVVARLVEERDGAAATAAAPGVDELANRRRARRWPRVLVAAAVVCVVAFGAGTVALRGLGSGAGDSSSAGSAPDSRADDRTSAREQESAGGGKALVPEGSAGAGDTALGDALPVPRLRSASLERDLRRLVAGASALPTGPGADRSPGRVDSRVGCTTPRLRPGEQPVDVRLDGAGATLVLSPVIRGAREARIYSCDDPTQSIATTRVQVR
jgi:hypothetical protein